MKNHYKIGLALGFPECCVMQFCNDRETGVMSAVVRGVIQVRPRTVQEIEAQPNLAVYMTEFGKPTTMTYVPCNDCAKNDPRVDSWLPNV